MGGGRMGDASLVTIRWLSKSADDGFGAASRAVLETETLLDSPVRSPYVREQNKQAKQACIKLSFPLLCLNSPPRGRRQGWRASCAGLSSSGEHRLLYRSTAVNPAESTALPPPVSWMLLPNPV